jgi:hypothetical protein
VSGVGGRSPLAYICAVAVTMIGWYGSVTAGPAVVVPITLKSHFPILTANINGHDVPLIFDSGNAATIAISQAVVDRVHAMPSGQTSRTMDIKGNVFENPKFTIARLQIGSAVFTNIVVDLDVHDPSYAATQVGQQGMLGASLFKEYKIVLDYRHRRMTLVPPNSTKDESVACKGISVPFLPASDGDPTVMADTDIGRPTMFFDTGAPASILSKQFAETARPPTSGNTLTSKRFVLSGTDFGPLHFTLEELDSSLGFDGFIGYDFLARHVVCMDFPGRRLLIQE